MGGAHWLFNLFLTIGCLPVAAHMYSKKDLDGKNLVVQLCSVLTICSVVLLVSFFANINKEYLATFLSTMRGKDLAMKRFLDSSDDAAKADAIFWNTKRYWNDIESQVEEWVRSNWEKWIVEKPAWFDEHIKARIPPHMIPNVEDRQKIQVLHERERESTLFGRVMEFSGRHSMTGVEKVVPGIIEEEQEEEENQTTMFAFAEPQGPL